MIGWTHKVFTPILFITMCLVFCFSCNKDDDTNPDDDTNYSIPTIHWTAEEDIIIENDLYIDSAKLVIDPGANIKIRNGCSLFLGTKYKTELSALGNSNKPINFTTYNPEGDPDKSFWGCINIGNKCDIYVSPWFDHCNFINGGGEGSEAVIIVYTDAISFSNCLIDHSKNYGILLNSANRFNIFSGNTIKHTLNHPLSISSAQVPKLREDNIFIVDSPNLGIYLRPYGQSGGKDTIFWPAQTVPYIMSGTLRMSGGNINNLPFKIEEGTTIAFEKNASMSFSTGLHFIAVGSEEKPIKFTSNELTPRKGGWGGILFWSGSIATIKNCIFEYGGETIDSKSEYGMLTLINATEISIEESVFKQSEKPPIVLDSYSSDQPVPRFAKFQNNTFIDLGSSSISLPVSAISSLDRLNTFNNYPIYVQNSTLENEHLIWKNIGIDYFLDSYVYVKGLEETCLEIEPGVKITFDGGGISIGNSNQSLGKLIAIGTEDKPIVFTSAKESPGRGDWGGILFNSNILPGTILKHCEILYGGGSIPNTDMGCIKISGNEDKVTVKQNTIAHSNNYGIVITGSAEPVLEDNNFFDNLSGDILIIGN